MTPQKRVLFSALVCSLCAVSYLYGKFGGPEVIQESNTLDIRRSGIRRYLKNEKEIEDEEFSADIQTEEALSIRDETENFETSSTEETKNFDDLNINKTSKDKASLLEKSHDMIADFNTSENTAITEEKKYYISSSEKIEGCSLTVPIPNCNCQRTLFIPENDKYNCADGIQGIEKIKLIYGSSTCSDLATLRGVNQSVISLSLWGAAEEYMAGARILAERIKSVYPGWILRLYHLLDTKNPNQRDWLCSMECDFPHVDICPVWNLPTLGDISKSAGSVWRFMVVGDPLISRYASRDADSPILQREVDAVHEWLKSGKCYHVMRDNKFHNVPMMAGMWGGCNWWQREAAVAARSRILHTRVVSSDQQALWSSIWPLAQRNGISHDSHSCKRFNALPFPTQRFNFTFIGQRTYRAKHVRDRVWPPCPEECRPNNHKDWIYC